MWSAVELRDIRVFLTLAEELHFGHTAERLGLTPSRVSQILRGFEAKLGARLVHRTSRRVQLTALGERFRDEVSDTCEELDSILQRTEAAGHEGRGTLRIGTFSGPATGPHFLRILREFSARHPDCVVDVQQLGRPDQQLDPLVRGEQDIVATWLPVSHPDLVVGPTLSEEPRVLAVSPDHPLAGRRSVSIEEVADYRVVRVKGLARDFHEAWVPSRTPSGRRIPSEPLKLGSLGEMVFELGYLVASGRVVHPTVPSIGMVWGNFDIVYVPIRDMPRIRSVLIWRRDARDATLRDFIRTAREVLRKASEAGRGVCKAA